MRHLSALFFIALLGFATPAYSVPLEGKFGVRFFPPFSFSNSSGGSTGALRLGLDAELGWKQSPWKIGGLVLANAPFATSWEGIGYPKLFTAWTSYTHHLAPAHSIGALVGGNYFYATPMAIIPEDRRPYVPPQEYGLVVGLTYEYQSGWFRFRLTPNSTLFSTPDDAIPSIFKSGIPWLELAVAAMPNLELGLGLSLVPFKASYVF